MVITVNTYVAEFVGEKDFDCVCLSQGLNNFIDPCGVMVQTILMGLLMLLIYNRFLISQQGLGFLTLCLPFLVISRDIGLH